MAFFLARRSKDLHRGKGSPAVFAMLQAATVRWRCARDGNRIRLPEVMPRLALAAFPKSR
jgi:hypothetical protein